MTPSRLIHNLHLLLLLIICPTSLSQTSTSGGDALADTRPSAVAGGVPVLQDQPFVVVWNVPTARCQKKYNVHLDLKDFGIVENRDHGFQGQEMTIFYRKHLGKYPYISEDGAKVNGGIPQSGDLPAHLSLAHAQATSLLRPNFTGLAVIDWESWHPLWDRNFRSRMEYQLLSKLLVRQERPGLTDAAVTSSAREMFEESARDFMEKTLQLAVRDRPGGFWGFYDFPACYNKRKRKKDTSYTGRCHKRMIKQNNRLLWLWRGSTALYPSMYLPRRMAGSPDVALMVRHRLLEALRVASLGRHGNDPDPAIPVIAYSRLAFIRTLKFLNETDLAHTLGESAALGAAGVVLWGELKFANSERQCILLREYIHTVLGPFISALRSGTRRCSLLRCHGNGRCGRAAPSASADPGDVELLLDSSGTEVFRDRFLCHCYPGWTGPECQERRGRRSGAAGA